MAQKDLVSIGDQTKEKQHEITSKGGKASGVARRKKKMLKEQLAILLTLPVKSEKTRKQLKELGLSDSEIDNQMALTIALYQRALSGDPKAYEVIRDTLGETTNKLEVTQVPVIKDDI